MPDIDHNWGGDVSAGPTGDLALVDGRQRGIERILRRLMTNSGEYIWHKTYGASVPRRIGDVIDVNLIKSVIRSQIMLEDAVARKPPPTIDVTPFLNGVVVKIAYVDAATGQQVSLSFDAKN